MPENARDTAQIEVVGTLHWNEHEGGFWSIDLADSHPELGDRAVLVGLGEPGVPRPGDGMRVRVLGTPRPEQVDFLMAGVRFEVAAMREVTT